MAFPARRCSILSRPVRGWYALQLLLKPVIRVLEDFACFVVDDAAVRCLHARINL